ncbi:MAG: ComEC/Rec2 family competence protein [Sphingomonadales bacterium]|nr:ComEC/Rec2 family competence protein [Sphingomonadales bacterium]
MALYAACMGIALCGFALKNTLRMARILILGSMLVALGFSTISLKSAWRGAKQIDAPWIGVIHGRIEGVEDVSARGLLRYSIGVGGNGDLPAVVRVNVEKADMGNQFASGDAISVKVRLMPPPGPALPGGYDFARTAWFEGIGATGRALEPPRLIERAAKSGDSWNSARNRLSAKIQKALGAETGPIGSALLVGARGAIDESDAEALRNSGMAHLLSVSGLHVTAIVGASFVLAAALLSLWPWFALRVRVPLVAAGFSALVAIFYTLLTGAEVPTVRACFAALAILAALALGREALSLRLLAAGATFVLLFWPEALAGPSFQLSFAAVATIIVLHASPFVRGLTARREQAVVMRWLRGLAMLLITGLAIELVLAPIALFHFHKSGLYGALANIVAIPLTTFVIMPAELLGLFADLVYSGWGAPFWWLAAKGIGSIIWIAHAVSSAPGAVAYLPEMPVWAFGTTILSAFVVAAFRTKWRWVAMLPLMAATFAMLSAPRPDMLLTGDGQHLAVIYDGGKLALLRSRAGDYSRTILGETAAVGEQAVDLDDMPGAICNPDACAFVLQKDGRNWSILALRSNHMIPAMELSAACRRADIVFSARRLPWGCKPRWLKADKALLERTGGLAFYMQEARVDTVAEDNAHHPWSIYSDERLRLLADRRAKEKAARKAPPLLKNDMPKPQ